MIHPTGRLAALTGSWATAGVAILSVGGSAIPWSAAGAVVCAAALLDLIRLTRTRTPDVRRHLPPSWSQGRTASVVLEVASPASRAVRLELLEHPPQGWEGGGDPVRLRLPPGGSIEVVLETRPAARGDARFAPPEVHLDAPWGLWTRSLRPGGADAVRALPDLARVHGQELDGATTPRAGARRQRRRGEGTEFHQLREYRAGDSLRAIDWKATARQGRPISREYREERDQQVVVLLDTGRRMTRRDGDRTRLDLALEAVLRLAWVASRQGDSVGLLAFSDRSRRWIAPAKGRTALDRILEGTYDLQAEDAPPDFLLAAEELRARVRRRALVVLVTALEEEDASTLRHALSLAGSRHLVLCASLRENDLDDELAREPRDWPSARSQAAILRLQEERAEAIRRLGLPRRLLLETGPRTLHRDLAERYLAIKGAGRL